MQDSVLPQGVGQRKPHITLHSFTSYFSLLTSYTSLLSPYFLLLTPLFSHFF